ncbi:MAG: hypothetical protein IPJ77_05320 [Planctomycetes bacterium]|nr:hypothetical protein [Planctomycetota bacterium]
MNRLVLVALPLVLLAACSAPKRHRYSPAEIDKLARLERGLVYVERTERGVEHPISRDPGDQTPVPPGGTAVQRVADGATVDVNSRIRVQLDDSLVPPNSRGTVVSAHEVEALVSDASALSDAITGIAEYRTAEADAVRLWRAFDSTRTLPEGDKAYAAFTEARDALVEKEQPILDRMMRLWPQSSPEFKQVDEEVNGMLLGAQEATSKFAARVQARLNALSAELQSFSNRTRRRAEGNAEHLVIEAVLIPSAEGKKATNVHVENYDTLDAGAVQRIDTLGLRLTESERANLARLTSETQRVADALERLRAGEASFEQVMTELSAETLQGLDELVADLRALRDPEFQRRADALKKAVDSFVGELGARLKEYTDAKKGAWSDAAQTLITDSKALQAIAGSVEALEALRARWGALQPADLPKLIADTQAALRSLRDAVQRFPEIVAGARGLLERLRADVEAAPPEVRALARDTWKESDLQRELEAWRAWYDRMRSRATALADLLGFAHAPVRSDLTNPNALSVPLTEARDASIDLRRTPRKAGDHLQVRARLLRGKDSSDTVEPDSVVTLELEKLGWHADLIPSVVFVEGDRVAGADDSGGFSTALSWMWSYGPRDDEGDPYLSRSFDWAFGLHAVFLNFGPDHDAEIGLGVTAGLWDQRIQVGAGYNPMAESEADGRFYYFIGSNLIPLLQALSKGD